jgi:hypothetical protein
MNRKDEVLLARLLKLNSQKGIEELKRFPERSSTESDVIFKKGEDGGREASLQEAKFNSNREGILFTA